jgi:predicted nucleic acid-binding protein
MIVLDASALVDVVIDQPPKQSVLEQLDQPIAAPAHQLAEVLSALARLVRAGTITPDVAREALDEAAALGQEQVAPSRRHLTRALDLQSRIRVLDGLYVALAEERQCPLVTTDQRLAGAETPCEVVLAQRKSAP